MKTITISLFAAALLAASGASAFSIKEYRSLPPVDLRLPATPDSLRNENPFENSKLLSSRLPLDFELQRQDWTTVTTDSSDNVSLVKPKDNPSISTYATKLRAERFSKGKLRISSTGMAEVLVNGKSVIKKTTSDSIPSDSDSKLELLPEKDYDIQINILSFPSDKSDPVFSLEYVPDKDFKDVALKASLDMKDRFSAETFSDGPRLSNVSVSPDGKFMILKYYQRHSKKERRQWAQIRETASGRVISADINNSAEWMPKGSRLYYTNKRAGVYDIYTIDLPSLKSTIVAKGIPINDFSFSPEEKYLFYYERVEGKEEKGVMHRYSDPDDRQPGYRDRYYLMRYDLGNGVVVPVTYGGASTTISAFSSDGKKLVYTSSVFEPSEYPFYFSSVIQLDVESLKTDTIMKRKTGISSVGYSPDNRKLLITAGPETFGKTGFNAGNHEIANEYDVQGYIYDIATGENTCFTLDFDPSLSGAPVWNPIDNMIYFKAQEGFLTNLYSMNPKTSKITKLPAQVSTVSNFSIGDEEKQWLAYVGQSFDYIGRGYIMNLKTGESSLIDDPMKDILSDIEFGEMQPWSFKASDGTMIDGMMCLPPDFDPSKKYPLIVYYYGGTTPSTATMHHGYTPQLFASRDYVVYVVNPSGTIGYGQEFSARHVNAWGKRTAEDIIEGVKKFCEEHPFVDDKKIGCLGASYGGFMTQYLQTLTDIFAAAVSHAGISNVTSYWGEGYWGYSYNAVAAAKSYPWNNPDLFTKQGSLFNADKIHTPLLLLHGTRDTNVPIGESIQLFNALKILGRDVEFITVEDQDHIINDYDKRKIWHNTIMAWFAKYLQDDPRWWDSMYGD